MKIDISPMMAELNDDEDVVFSDVKGLYIIITKSDRVFNTIADAVENPATVVNPKKGGDDE